MNDSRIQQIRALLDDARTLCADILEEVPPDLPDADRLTICSGFCNAALTAVRGL